MTRAVIEGSTTLIAIEGASGHIQIGSPGLDGRGIKSVGYDPATGQLTITLTDDSSLITADLRGGPGPRGIGLDAVAYNAATGQLMLTLTDGQAVQTGDLRGPPGPIGPANINIDGGAVTATPAAFIFDGGSP